MGVGESGVGGMSGFALVRAFVCTLLLRRRGVRGIVFLWGG